MALDPVVVPPIVVPHDRLADFIVSVLEALKMSPKNARLTADLMVRTDLRGVDSHGIGMLPKYVEWTQAGFVHPWADPVVARDDLATALVDAQKGLGHPASAMSMELAISKAATYGMGIVAVRNSNHFGACANYSMMALARGMIGLAFTNSPFVAMVPTFGRKPMMGTNPISVAAPAGRREPYVLDMATTTVAVGKLHVASRWNKPVPEGWGLAGTSAATRVMAWACWSTFSRACWAAPSTATCSIGRACADSSSPIRGIASRPSTSSAFGPWRSSRPTWTTCWAHFRTCRRRTGTSACTRRDSRRPRPSGTAAPPASR